MSEMGSSTVSVIMNCLNGEKYLHEAIDSVFAQTYQDWEIIFWDNASTDASAEIAKSYGKRVRYFRSEETYRLGKARNLAITEARGDYIALLDCDDLWLPEKLEQQVSLLDSDPVLGLVYSDSFVIDQHGNVLRKAFQRTRPPDGDPFMGLLTRPNFIPCLTVLMRRSVLEKVGGFNPGLKYCEDFDLFVRIASGHAIAYLDAPLARFRLHSNNMTGTGSPGTTEEAIEVIKKITKDMNSLSHKNLFTIRKRLIALRCKLISQYFRRDHIRRLFHHTVGGEG
jgi:glycosyltransferase involved in cell wall biosynthesis